MNIGNRKAAAGETWGNPQTIQPGLYVEEGIIKLAGKPFYGTGTNYYDAALRPFCAPASGDIEKGIQYLAEYGFPYIRARFSAWGAEGMDCFWNDRETFFAATDYFVKMCEKYKVGIIATLVWTLNQYVNEETPTFADVLTDTTSKGYRQILEYCEAIVTRYKNSPAIWGWEIGNEFNLDADMNSRDVTKGFSTEVMSNFYADLSKRIHEWDGTDRIISSGSSQDRGSSFNLATNGTWQRDTIEEMEKIYEIWNPDDLTVTSIHVYNRLQWLNGERVPLKEYLEGMIAICRKLGKPLLVGEYCDDEWNSVPERTEEIFQESLEKFQVLHDSIVACDVQLPMLWIYWPEVDPYVQPTGHLYANYYKYMLDRAKEANENFVSQGKQDTDSYWNSVTNVIH